MINDFIRQDQTIILAVVPANVDIATTEALQMAKRVDKEGKRTLGEKFFKHFRCTQFLMMFCTDIIIVLEIFLAFMYIIIL